VIEYIIMTEKLKILFVDDEKTILTSLEGMFKKQYAVFTATNGSDALDIIHKHSIQIIVSDQRMPADMSGIELLAEVKEISPNTIGILLSSYADIEVAIEFINNNEIFRFVEKPWNKEQIKNTIEAAASLSTPVTEHLALLVVSNDIEIYAIVHHLFGHKLNIYYANQLEKALNILEHHNIGILLTDTLLQRDKINTLIQIVNENNPLTISIVLSTQGDAHLIANLINEGKIFRYLPKPVDKQLLEFNINAALKAYADSHPELSLSNNDEETSVSTKEKSEPLTNKLKSLGKRINDFWHH